MDKIESEKLKFDFTLQTLANEELFAQWLRNFFYLNEELNKEYDTIYQNSFYVIFYELSTTGIEYSKNVLTHLDNSQNFKKKEFYNELMKGLINLKSLFSESEFEFIEYKRHSFSHIFQNYYQKRILKNGKILTKRGEKLIDVLTIDFSHILLKYGFDRGFDEYMDNILYPNIRELYIKLKRDKIITEI